MPEGAGISAVARASLRRVLVIQTAFLGDVVFSTALLHACRDIFPGAEVTLLASPRGGGILEGDPVVREIVYYDKRGSDRGLRGLAGIIGVLRKRNFELVVSPHRSFRSALIARLTGAGTRVGFPSAATWWAWNLGIGNPAAEKRPYRREMMLMEDLAGRRLRNRPVLHVGERERGEVKRLFDDCGLAGERPVVGFVVGTVWPTKRWPVDSYLQLGREIVRSGQVRVAVIGGRDDAGLAAPFEKEPGIVNLTGMTALRQLPAVLERCGVLVAGDTGPLHAALALGVKVVALFGPTAEEQFEFGPGDRCLVADLACRPCRPHGSVSCPEGDWRCMPDIPVGTVKEAVREALGR